MKKSIICILLVLAVSVISADTVELKNGDLIICKVMYYNQNKLIVKIDKEEKNILISDVKKIQIEPEIQNKVIVPRNGLIGEFLFNGNLKDTCGTNNGINHGAIATYDRFNKPNYSYYFNGDNTFIEIPHSNSVNVNNIYSISLWIMPDFSCYYGAILSKSEKGNDQCFLMYDNGGVNYVQNYKDSWLNAHGTIQPNEWNHIVIVVDLNKIFIYINGQLFNKMPHICSQTQKNSRPLYIGMSQRDINVNKYYKGLIDDIRIYNRVLTKEEVEILFSEK